MSEPRNHIKVFVASTIYNFQTELNQIFDLIDSYGYDVINSHKGTVDLDHTKSNLNICLDSVDECDVFVGFIRPDYGSGVLSPGALSITHQEFQRAVRRNIPRFILVDHRVSFTKSLIRKAELIHSYSKIKIDSSNIEFNDRKIMDIRCVRMYEEMIKDNIPPPLRIGHWVQEYENLNDIKLHIESQFKYPNRIQALINKSKGI